MNLLSEMLIQVTMRKTAFTLQIKNHSKNGSFVALLFVLWSALNVRSLNGAITVTCFFILHILLVETVRETILPYNHPNVLPMCWHIYICNSSMRGK